jgi:hypothetical protein
MNSIEYGVMLDLDLKVYTFFDTRCLVILLCVFQMFKSDNHDDKTFCDKFVHAQSFAYFEHSDNQNMHKFHTDNG